MGPVPSSAMPSLFDEHWHRRFLALSEQIATWSKDPSRGVGAVIVSPSKQIVSTGFNGLPRGVEDRPDRLERPVKYDLIVHAEMNAILNKNSGDVRGARIYVTLFPCHDCTKVIIQSGVKEVIYLNEGRTFTESHKASKLMLEMANVNLRKHRTRTTKLSMTFDENGKCITRRL